MQEQDKKQIESNSAIQLAEQRRYHLTEALKASIEAASLDLELKLREAVTLTTVMAEKTEDGKPVYPSEDRRKAEITIRLRYAADYCHAEALRDERKQEARTHEIEADYCRDMLRVFCAFAEKAED